MSYKVGDEVILHSLNKNQYNGLFGIINHIQNDRYIIKVIISNSNSIEKQLSLKKENIVLIKNKKK
jgi:hypothetical protein